jgi:hypothetical protein
MYTSMLSNASRVMSRPQIYFPEQRLGAQSSATAVQSIQPISPEKSAVSQVKNLHGDSFQRSVQSTAPKSALTKARPQVSEQSTPDDLPTSAFAKLGSSVGMVFGIQF